MAGGIHFRTQKGTVTGLGWFRKCDGQGMVQGDTVQCGDSPGVTALRGEAEVVRRKPVNHLAFLMFLEPQ